MKIDTTSPSWKSWAVTIGGIVAVFAAFVIVVTFQTRREVRQQILDRDAEVLASVARMLQTSQQELDAAGLMPDDLEIALQTSRLRGVLAVRLFDENGFFSFSVPYDVIEADIEPEDQAVLADGQPVAYFHPKADLGEIFELTPEMGERETFPLQEVLIPLFAEDGINHSGAAQYLIDGEPVKAELAALDRTLLLQSGTAFALGSAALLLIAALAFYRLRRSHLALAEQTERLIRANKELAAAARTSAVGAVTSHLIHGIRNPITGLDLFFQTRNTDELPGQSPESWRQLAEATNRIRELVDEVVEVLRAQDTTTSYELSLAELESVLQEKLAPKTNQAGIRFETGVSGDGRLSGHVANILILIIVNLVENALSVTPKEKAIRVQIKREAEAVTFDISDEGPGIPDDLQAELFTPGKSGRPGGAGLGLAISHRLAVHINGSLELAKSDDQGTVFSLRIPLEEAMEEENSMAARPRDNGETKSR